MKKSIFMSLLLLGGFIYSQNDGQCIVGDCENGEGTIVYENGNKYEGYWEDGAQIEGVYYWVDGDEYEGNFKDNMRHGVGTMNWSDGRQYSGDWKNNMMNGYGIYFVSEDRYEGGFKDNLFNGQGTYFWSDGDKYEGLWANGKINGQGMMIKAEYIDEGLRIDGERQGLIERSTLSGDKLYEIEFVAGLINGYTRLYNKKGEVITEEFLKDELGDNLVTDNKVYFYDGSYETTSDSKLTMCADESFVFYYSPAPKDQKYFSKIDIGPFNLDDIIVFEFCSKRVFVDTKQPVSGIVYETYSNGNVKYQMTYKNGKYDGKWNLCYDFNGEDLGKIKAKKIGKSVKTQIQGESGWSRKTVRTFK